MIRTCHFYRNFPKLGNNINWYSNPTHLEPGWFVHSNHRGDIRCGVSLWTDISKPDAVIVTRNKPIESLSIYDMSKIRLSITSSSSRLKFSKRDQTKWPWWHDLDLDGEQLYRIGSSCDTCDVVLERFANAKFPIAPAELGQQLPEGLSFVPQSIVDTAAEIFPNGEYIVVLLNYQPKLIDLNSQADQEPPGYL